MESNRFAAPSRRERRLRVANVVVVECRRVSSSDGGWTVGRSVGRLVGRTERRGKNIASLVTVFSSFGCKISSLISIVIVI